MNHNTDIQLDQTDLTFFTNKDGHSLLNRFKATLKDTQAFDVLVGYFRASGFNQLYKSLEPIEKIRILIGLNVDRDTYETIESLRKSDTLDFESHKNTKRKYQKELKDEIENSTEDDKKLEEGVKKFIEFLQTDCPDLEIDKQNNGNGKKLEIRAYPSKDIHAKVYIGKYKPDDRDYGFVITGSSNFSESGFIANREFNVELKNKADILFAEKQFNKLWNESVDISQDFVETINNDTWINNRISPYELYLKLIYEYLEEDINLNEDLELYLPKGFIKLEYQNQAVKQAKKILETYNGVFLSDVVGLGKTFVTAMLLQQLQGKKLIICPPVLKEYWEDSLRGFGVRNFEVQSLGKLESIIKKGVDRFDYVIVDEAHRFRNENTQAYADLLDICRNKKIILVTATPLNNSIDDIFAQLKLFQAPKDSTIPGIPNLENFFANLRSILKSANKDDPEYKLKIKEVSKQISSSILRYVMVRRTRTDVKKYFKKDIESQGLHFPHLQDPEKIIYEFEGNTEDVFLQTIEKLKQFTYSRYTPLLYYSGELTNFEKQQQLNIGGFMKGILVKRLESSFYAFRKSVSRFIKSYEKFIDMYENQEYIYISKKVDVYELLENDDIDKLDALVEEDKAQRYSSKDFKDNFIEDLNIDLSILKQINQLWQTVDDDPKLEEFTTKLNTAKQLKNGRLIIFTESKETGDYLFEKLSKNFPEQVVFYSSSGGIHNNSDSSLEDLTAHDLIKANFDPNFTGQKLDNIKILITTDVLAEGTNLHRSNILINYDLPWNPTRVLQRAGRINRIGSEFENIHIFNFFPTTQSDEHLNLETNITNKIQMFHDILGEDAKYLSDGEEISSQELFETLNDKSAYTGETGEEDSELKYLEILRHLRDNDPDFFHKIKKLPKKARSGYIKDDIKENHLVTFFRIGKLKKFYLNKQGASKEITFYDAVDLLACNPDTPRAKTPEEYHDWLKLNKTTFETDSDYHQEPPKTKGGRSNAKYIEKRLKDKFFTNYKGFTESDQEYISKVKQMYKQGIIAKKISQRIKNNFEKTTDPIAMLNILKKHIRFIAGEENKQTKKFQKREVILSGYLLK